MKRFVPLAAAADATAVTTAFAVSFALRYVEPEGTKAAIPYALGVSAFVVAVWIASLAAHGAYRWSSVANGITDTATVFRASITAFAVTATTSYITRAEFSRVFILVAFPIGTALLMVGRRAIRQRLHRALADGTIERCALVVLEPGGEDEVSKRLPEITDIPINEITRPEIDRMTGMDAVHQGIALAVPAYNYQHPIDLLDKILDRGQTPLLVALDGITDPRNLGAIIRSVAAFGGQGVILPQRRSTGVTAAAWKTSAGAAARVPVALAGNLNNTLKELKKRGLFVVGLDGDGDMSLPQFNLSNEPLVLVIGSEGKGLSRLVQENCDAVVSIPINADTESLNAGIAASVALYEVAKSRLKK